jgi:RimJ/RimL family protein N-acetyltransferase
MFTPGTVIHEFTNKKGREITFRFIVESDAPLLLDYINTLSREDTFIRLSGEQYTLAEEQKYVGDWLVQINANNKIALVALDGEKVVSFATVDRLERRSKHVGHLAISVAKEYREEGIGKEILITLLELSPRMGLQMIELSAYSPNKIAIGLYSKLGFNEVGRIPKKALFHGELVDEVIMVKFL